MKSGILLSTLSIVRCFLFRVHKLVLVHFFKKTSKKTPKSDLDLGWDRMKKWVHAEKATTRKTKKGQKGHAQKK